MNQYQDEHDDQQRQRSGGVFQRWNWKLGRAVQRLLFLLVVLFLLWTGIPALLGFITSPNFAPLLLQLILLTGYLLLFISFQMVLIYFFLARTRIYWVRPTSGGIRFADYQGNPTALTAAQHIVRLLNGVRNSRKRGAGSGDVLRGLLLTGMPGVGKRYLAQAIASEAAVPIGYLNATSLTTSRIGLGQLKVAMLYRRARKLAREYGACILLIDSIEAIGSTAAGHSSVLNEVLLQIDPPFQPRSWWRWLGLSRERQQVHAVLTIATASNPELLDPTILRPGRFDRQIAIDLPDAAGRRAIIAYYLEKVPHDPLPIDQLATDMSGHPPVTIKQIINESLVYARLAHHEAITYQDVRQVIAARLCAQAAPGDEQPYADPKEDLELNTPPTTLSYRQRRRIAYYEAGAVYTRFVRTRQVDRIGTEMPDSTRFVDLLEHYRTTPATTRAELMVALQVELAGRAAEEELLGIQSTSALDDLERATGLAALLTGVFGMDGSLVSHLALNPQPTNTLLREDLREPIATLIEQQYAEVRCLIAHNRAAVALLAEALILPDAFNGQDLNHLLRQIIKRYPLADPAATQSQAPQPGLFARRTQTSSTTESRRPARRSAVPDLDLDDIVPASEPVVYQAPQPATVPVETLTGAVVQQANVYATTVVSSSNTSIPDERATNPRRWPLIRPRKGDRLPAWGRVKYRRRHNQHRRHRLPILRQYRLRRARGGNVE